MDKMDIVDVQNACEVAAMPKEVVEKIWKKKANEKDLEMYKEWYFNHRGK